MCRTASGIGIYFNDVLNVFVSRYDRHNKIMEDNRINGMRDSMGMITRMVPLEYTPKQGATLDSPEHWELSFDDQPKPDWWTDDMTEHAEQSLWIAFRARFSDDGKIYNGDLNLYGAPITSLCGIQYVVGYINIRKTKIKIINDFSVWGRIDM